MFTGLLSWLLLRERPRLSWVVATSVCVVGLVLLVGSQASSGSGDALGYLLALTSGLGYAFYTVASKRLMNAGHGSDEVMAAAFGLGGLLLLPVLLTQPMAWIATPSGLAMALWLGLITTTLVLAEPVVATLLGVLVLGETIPAVGWAGIALVLAGLALQGAASRLGDGQSLP